MRAHEARASFAWEDSEGAETYSLWLSTEAGVFGDEEFLVEEAEWATA